MPYKNLKNIKMNNKDNSTNQSKELVYGLKGIAKVLGVSRATVVRLKKQGVFDKIIYQRNKTIIVEKDKILPLFADKKDE